MERCKECELAVYCFSDSSSWIFRTKREMEEKKEVIANCPVHEQVEQALAARDREAAAGSREQGASSRKQEAGSRKQ